MRSSIGVLNYHWLRSVEPLSAAVEKAQQVFNALQVQHFSSCTDSSSI
jgi:hypothetical protein